MPNYTACQGKRRSWSRGVLATRKCRRKATVAFQTYVGLTRSHVTCGDEECTGSITQGYGAMNYRQL